jgi:hypothetical protein
VILKIGPKAGHECTDTTGENHLIFNLEYLFLRFTQNIRQMAPDETEPHTTPFPCLFYVYINSMIYPKNKKSDIAGNGWVKVGPKTKDSSIRLH